MSRRNAGVNAEAPGQDSFLDVVSNLVGVLIILIMVLGTRARQAYVTQRAEAIPTAPSDLPDLEGAVRDHNIVAAEIAAIRTSSEKQAFEIAYRNAERKALLDGITLAERQIKDERNKLNADDREKLEAKATVEKLRSELEQIGRAKESLSAQEAPTEVLEHRPTPIARTVWDKEVQFHLSGGRISFIPLEQIQKAMVSDFRASESRLDKSVAVKRTIGPIGGFLVAYSLGLADSPDDFTSRQRTQGKPAIEFALIPTSDDIGELVSEALQEGSEFLANMREVDPRSTITVWVYPDSFSEFRQIRDRLYKMKFVAAARPLSSGSPMRFSSVRGSRSSGQ